jgi:hypothetical protein
MPKETREPDFAFATSALAACPAAASASSNNNAAEQAAAQCSALLDGIQQAASNAAPSTATPKVGGPAAATQSGTGEPDIKRFGAILTKPDEATAAAATITNVNST